MQPSDPGLRVAVGVSGSGKSVVQRADAYAASRTIPVLYIDAMNELTAVPESVRERAAGARDVPSALAHIRAGKTFVVIQPGESLLSAVVTAAQWCAEPRAEGIRGLVIPEAHMVAPVSGPVPIELMRLATQWRHHKTAMWCDAQRIATLHHSITDNARELRIFAQWGDADMRRVAEIGRKGPGGEALVEAIDECARRLAPHDEGGDDSPGWHVKLGMRRIPPFNLQKARLE